MSRELDLSSQVTLITGAGMGVGRATALRLTGDAIRVSTIVPRSVLTGFGGRSIEEKTTLIGEDRKYLEPDDVARAVVYLRQTPDGAWTQEMTLWPA